MSGEKALAFVDTNVLVYAFDKKHSARNNIAQELLSELIDQDRICLSTQVFQEFFVVMTRKVNRPCRPDEALVYLDDFTAWPVFVVDYRAIRDAGMLAQDAILSFWDALIVVAAARSGAERLYTEDLNHGQQLLGVEIVNPFLSLASETEGP